MTEGPEATYLANYIGRHFKGKRLRKISIRAGRYKHHDAPTGIRTFSKEFPTKLLDIYKKGKVLFLLFEGNWCLIARMGMTGWFSKPEDKPIFESEPHVVFEFENGELQFFDFRNFGTLVFTDNPIEIVQQIEEIAPDILDKSVTVRTILDRIQELQLGGAVKLEEVLMDQTAVVSGVGNIIKSELLYDARLSPKRPIRSMSRADWTALFHSARKVSKKILRNLMGHGLDFKTYFQLHAVYKKDADPEGRPVKNYKSADGRTTYWVPEVQN
jgi:formamidopyrimidine-DNA glycosylase